MNWKFHESQLRVRFFVDCQLNGGVNGCLFVNAVEVNRVFSSTAASVELPVGSTARPSSTRLGEAGWTSTEGKPRPQTRSTVSSTATRFFVNGAFLLNFLAQLVVHEKTHPWCIVITRSFCFRLKWHIPWRPFMFCIDTVNARLLSPLNSLKPWRQTNNTEEWKQKQNVNDNKKAMFRPLTLTAVYSSGINI